MLGAERSASAAARSAVRCMLLLGTARSDPLLTRSPTRQTTNLAASGLARKKTVNISRLDSLDTMPSF
jgi:hypothetical protein